MPKESVLPDLPNIIGNTFDVPDPNRLRTFVIDHKPGALRRAR
jgi:hypothetical protein